MVAVPTSLAYMFPTQAKDACVHPTNEDLFVGPGVATEIYGFTLQLKAPAVAEAFECCCGLRLLRSRLRFGVFAAEALDSSRGVDQLLFAGEEGVATRADFDVDVALVCGAGGEGASACADDTNFVVVGVDSCFRHDLFQTFPAILLF